MHGCTSFQLTCIIYLQKIGWLCGPPCAWGLNELIKCCYNKSYSISTIHSPWGYEPLMTLQPSMNMHEIIMGCRKGCSSLIEELLLLLSPHGLWLLIFLLHWLYARSSFCFFRFSILSFVTGSKKIFCHMAKVMTCVAFHMAKICSKTIRYPTTHDRSKPCMKCVSPPLVRSTITCLMAKQEHE